jgi:hypothetical protein
MADKPDDSAEELRALQDLARERAELLKLGSDAAKPLADVAAEASLRQSLADRRPQRPKQTEVLAERTRLQRQEQDRMAAESAARGSASLPQTNSNYDSPQPWELQSLWNALRLLGGAATKRQYPDSQRPAEKASVSEGSWTPDDWAVAAISALIAVPLCEAGWHAVVNEPERFARGFTAICVGLPLGLAGFSFHRWKTKIPIGARNLIGGSALKWWPVSVLLAFVYFAGPDIYQRATAPQTQTQSFGFGEATQPPPKPRSKETITELLNESDALLGIVQKTGLPFLEEWRTITIQNPERICLDLDSHVLQDKITTLANKLDAAHREISNIYERNRIDQVEFNKVFGSPMTGVGPSGFAVAAQSLRQYAHEINLLGEHPTCENLIRVGNVPYIVVTMERSFDQFSIWIAQSQENLNRYQDNLRKELRNAP